MELTDMKQMIRMFFKFQRDFIKSFICYNISYYAKTMQAKEKWMKRCDCEMNKVISTHDEIQQSKSEHDRMPPKPFH